MALKMTVSEDRLKRVVEAAGDSGECPVENHECWRHKEIDAYQWKGSLAETECRECWWLYVLRGV